MPDLYIISGCNGAGKTTASYTILPEILHCKGFVNADNIAAGFSPFNPDNVAFEAGRIMLTRIRELIQRGQDFGFETTLATRSYASLIGRRRRWGTVTLLYFWLYTSFVAVEQVKYRVRMGGHFIPEDTTDRLSERIIFGVRKAVRKMIEERAAIGEVVMVGDGEEGFKYVPAKELLESMQKDESEQ